MKNIQKSVSASMQSPRYMSSGSKNAPQKKNTMRVHKRRCLKRIGSRAHTPQRKRARNDNIFLGLVFGFGFKAFRSDTPRTENQNTMKKQKEKVKSIRSCGDSESRSRYWANWLVWLVGCFLRWMWGLARLHTDYRELTELDSLDGNWLY